MDLSELKNFDINSLDVNNLGSAPGAVKAIIIGLLFIAVLGAGYYFDTKGQLEQLASEERKETQLRQKFETEQRKVANLEELKQQLEEMRRSFGAMLRQLPSKTEIPNLIVDVSQTGLASGLEIDLFRPQDEVRKGFYAEKPIQLRVVGNYHQMGDFVSGVAALPRIVTLHDINIKPMDDGRLTMEALAKTYRYLDEQSGE
ncbi:MAG TPA: pilus assembly protein PilO [Thioalkalivibrio sp.]|nr:pilus assembly protein PilO [Thioalkalivibrio sp.]